MQRPSVALARIIALTLATALCLTCCVGCGGNAVPSIAAIPISPSALRTSPPTIWPSNRTLWRGTWTLDAATPAGDCWVDGQRVPETWTNMTIAIDRTGQSITMDFWSGYEKDGGYTPDVFVGTVSEAGQITASPRAYSEIYNTWTRGPGCYDHGWTIERGQLSGTLSPDGRVVSGNIDESFRAIPQGQIFTIRSHFTAASPQ